MGKDHNIDELTNKGWDMMRRTLDEEMPEKKRSRRAIWWWMAAAVCAGLIGVGGRQWWYRPLPSGSTALEAGAKTAATATATPQADELQRVEPATSLNTAPTATGNKHQTSSTATTTVAHTEKNAGTGHRTHKNALGATPTGAPILNTIATSSTDNLETDPAPTTDTQHAGSEAISSAQKNLSVLTPLPGGMLTAQALTLTNPATPENAREKSLLKPADLHQWHLGLVAGTLTSGMAAPNGFAAGAAVSWQPLKRWGLRAGLQYAYQHSNTQALGLSNFTAYDYYSQAIVDAAKSGFSLDNSTGTPAVTASNVTPDSLRQETLTLPVNSISRLELPLSVFFQARPRLRLYAGASIGYVLRATTSATAITGSRFLNRAAQGNTALLRSTNPSALQQLVTTGFPKFDTRLMLNLGWRPYQWLELNAGWQYAPGVNKSGAATAAESLNANPLTTFDPNRNTNAYKVKASTLTLGATFWLY